MRSQYICYSRKMLSRNDTGIKSWTIMETAVVGHMVHWMYDIDEDVCFFVDFLLCAEKGVIYIVDVFGFSRHVWLTTRDVSMDDVRAKVQNEEFMYEIDSIRHVLKHMFNGYHDVRLYDHEAFYNEAQHIIQTTKTSLHAIAPCTLPLLVEESILHYAIPEWCTFVNVPNSSEHINAGRSLSTYAHDIAVDHLYAMALGVMGKNSFHMLESKHPEMECVFHTCTPYQNEIG